MGKPSDSDRATQHCSSQWATGSVHPHAQYNSTRRRGGVGETGISLLVSLPEQCISKNWREACVCIAEFLSSNINSLSSELMTPPPPQRLMGFYIIIRVFMWILYSNSFKFHANTSIDTITCHLVDHQLFTFRLITIYLLHDTICKYASSVFLWWHKKNP